MDSLVRARGMTGFSECVAALGGDAEAILTQAGLTPKLLRNPEAWVSFKAVMRAFELAAQRLKAPDFGVQIARARDFTYLGPIYLAARYSDTLGNALDAASRFIGIQNTGYQIDTMVTRKAAWRSYHLAPGLRDGADQWIEESLYSSTRFIARLLGEEFTPRRYRMRHQPTRPLKDYARDFPAPVLFGQESDDLELDPALLQKPLPGGDAATRAFLTRYLQERVLPQGMEVEGAARALLETLIPIQQANLETVAAQLMMHPRTLQRRLSERGHGFSQILEETRKAMAERLLREGNLPLTNVASYLGYSEQSAFNHAFERWFGMAPRQWARRQS